MRQPRFPQRAGEGGRGRERAGKEKQKEPDVLPPRFPQGCPGVKGNQKGMAVPTGARLGGTLGSPKVPPQGKVLRKVPPRFPQKSSPQKVAPKCIIYYISYIRY